MIDDTEKCCYIYNRSPSNHLDAQVVSHKRAMFFNDLIRWTFNEHATNFHFVKEWINMV